MFQVKIAAPVVLVGELRRRGARAARRHRGRGAPARDVGARGTRQRERDLQAWVAGAPRLIATWDPLIKIYRRSLVDLAALRFETGIAPGALPAAGLPWFMAVFGRDSLLTSFQALAFVPELAATTLRALALLQARKDDPFRDAEPGKILHEIRLGEMTAFEERPHSPYYGAADATMLFLIVLEEYERWTGDTELVRELEREARAALAWIDNYGDRDGDGYVEYERRNRRPASTTSAGRTRGTRSRSPTARWRRRRAPPASCRATSTTPSTAAPAWPARSGTIPPAPTSWTRRRRSSSAASTRTSGSRSAASSRWRSTARSARSTR